MLTAVRSDIGKVRSTNEDSAWVGKVGEELHLAVVADGMGGHLAGDIASQTAVLALRQELEQYAQRSEDSDFSAEALRTAIAEVNNAVYALSRSRSEYYNMGTTVVAALLYDTAVIIGYVGDSRAYLLRNDCFEQLTVDHTLVNELVRAGQISQEEAANHPRRNVLVRAIGTDPSVDVDVCIVHWQPGDILLLCSDGLTNMVNEDQISHIIGEPTDSLEQKADLLIDRALQAGGDDNVTVLLVSQSPENRGGRNV